MIIEAPTITTPEPGAHKAVPFDVYRTWKALNHSVMEAAHERSPAHAKLAMDTPKEQTDAMAIGTAMHLLILEPDEYAKRSRIMPEINARSSTERAARAAMIASEPSDCIWLTKEDDWALTEMQKNVRANGLARKISGSTGDRELSILSERSGVPVKCRVDKVCPGVALVDLKTTRDASARFFERDAVNRGYHRQAAWYLEIWERLTGEKLPYVIIAVENDAPYGVNTFSLHESLIECGKRQNDELFAAIEPCWKSGVWPSYPERLNEIIAPEWMVKGLGI